MSDHRPIVVVALLLLGLPIAAELALTRASGRLPGVIASLWCGLLEQGTGALLYAALLAGYAALHRLAPVVWPIDSPLTWIGGFCAVDLVFYAYHRFSHRTALGWAAHQVHHQLGDLHLAAAVRNSPVGGTLQMAFLWPLALLGLPPAVFVVAKAANPLYQLWIHTRTIGRLPVLDLVLNTPSNHRVHHGVEEEYHDKNLGGILMVWDHLFGTYRAERAEPTYGVSPAFGRLDPIVANAVGWLDLAREVRRRGPRALLGPPAQGIPRPGPEPTASLRVRAWVVAQTVLAVLLLAWALSGPLDARAVALGAIALAGGSASAAWLEGRAWAPWLDALRGLALAVVLLG